MENKTTNPTIGSTCTGADGTPYEITGLLIPEEQLYPNLHRIVLKNLHTGQISHVPFVLQQMDPADTVSPILDQVPSATLEPITLSGWYELTDGRVQRFDWRSGVLEAGAIVASWEDVREPTLHLEGLDAEPYPQVSVSNPTPSNCVGDGWDVSMSIGGVEGEVTLIADDQGTPIKWGAPDNWLSRELLAALDDREDRVELMDDIESLACAAICAGDVEPSPDEDQD